MKHSKSKKKLLKKLRVICVLTTKLLQQFCFVNSKNVIILFKYIFSCHQHLIFELSHDQTSQDKLVKELKGALDHLDPTSEEYYETVTSSKNCTLPFMNACISETLRKYPPTNRLERRCSKAGYKVGGVQLEKDQLVEIPIYAVHYNSDYFSEPMIFKPERFLSENAHLLVPYTYMPFGLGPRNCVAMRFAYQEIKMCIATVFRKFRFQATPKTPKVLGFCTLQFFFTTKPFETFVTRR